MNAQASGGSSRPAIADDDDEDENDNAGESWFAGGERRSHIASLIYARNTHFLLVVYRLKTLTGKGVFQVVTRSGNCCAELPSKLDVTI